MGGSWNWWVFKACLHASIWKATYDQLTFRHRNWGLTFHTWNSRHGHWLWPSHEIFSWCVCWWFVKIYASNFPLYNIPVALKNILLLVVWYLWCNVDIVMWYLRTQPTTTGYCLFSINSVVLLYCGSTTSLPSWWSPLQKSVQSRLLQAHAQKESWILQIRTVLKAVWT